MGTGDYAAFLETKAPFDRPTGMRELRQLPSALKPFQRALTAWALRRGRAALFAGTGLGKTLMQLSWATAVADAENAPVLLLTPLAVAEQTVAEAAKFGIDGVGYALDERQRHRLTVTNYERFEKFRIGNFAGIVLDESGIIKSHDGKTRAILTEACATMPWRLCCTATPAPNDYTELGQHAEFLGVMTAAEMLAMFFVHDGSIRAGGRTSAEWRLKRHAEADFWRWLASWGAVVRSPADLGFDEPGYGLPPLSIEQITVAADYAPTGGLLFPAAASTLAERIAVRRDTSTDRVRAAVQLVEREPNEPWLIWCNLNSEASAIETALRDCRQVAGSHPIDTKVSRLLGFTKGDPRILCSKPTIAGHGLNYQHCARVVFVGLTDSFEQVFQAIRRCWRFGQTRPVKVYMVASELEGAVVANLRRKEADYERMLDAMAGHMRELVQANVLGASPRASRDSTLPMELPAWL